MKPLRILPSVIETDLKVLAAYLASRSPETIPNVIFHSSRDPDWILSQLLVRHVQNTTQQDD